MRLVTIMLLCAPTVAIAQNPPGKIAFTRVREDVNRAGDYRTEAEIWVMDGDGTHARRITHNTSDDFGTAWSPDGRKLVFGASQFSPDSSGALVLRTQHIYSVDVDGGKQTLITPPDMRAQFPSWSPDGSRIAFHGSRGGAPFEIFLMNPDGSGLQQLTQNDWIDARPDWSPDGRRIAFQSTRNGTAQIFVMNADGSNAIQLTKSEIGVSQAPDWSPDGNQIVFQTTRDDDLEIYVMNSDGSAQTRLTNNPGQDADAEWSSDGTRIVFDRGGGTGVKAARQMYLMNPDGTQVAPLTSLPSSNGHAAWSRPAKR